MRSIRNTLTLCILCFCAVGLVACEAFNDHNQEGEIIAGLSDTDLGVSAPTEGGGASGDAVVQPCPGMDGVTAEAMKVDAGVTIASAMNDLGADAVATKVDDTTTTIVVTQGSTEFAVTIKAEENAYTVCDAGYKVGSDQKKVTGGKIGVAAFNLKDGDMVVNQGTFAITVTEADSATKAMAELVGTSEKDGDVSVKGSYATEGFSE